MDDTALLAELARLDDPVYAEYPGGWVHWDQDAAEAQFLRLVETLATRLECPTRKGMPSSRDPADARVRECTLCYVTGAYIQDASFHGEILLPQALLTAETRERLIQSLSRLLHKTDQTSESCGRQEQSSQSGAVAAEALGRLHRRWTRQA